MEPTISEYAIPIKVKGKPFALINVESVKLAAFKNEDTKLITILVDHLTSALEKIEYQRQLEVLHQHSIRIAKCKTREEVAHETMKVIHEVIGQKVGSFGYVEKDRIRFLETVRSTMSYLPPGWTGDYSKSRQHGKESACKRYTAKQGLH